MGSQREFMGMAEKECIANHPGGADFAPGMSKENRMTFKEAAMHYYTAFDMNCAEAALRGANDVLALGLGEDAFSMMHAFGSGCGCGSLCGAVTGYVAAISYAHAKSGAHHHDAKNFSGKFVTEVKRRLESEQCVVLRKKFHSKEAKCGLTVAQISQIMDDMKGELFQ